MMQKENPDLKVVEALPAKYFNQGHIPNALNIPLDSSDEEIKKLLPNIENTIVTYCTGPTCPNSGKFAEWLTWLARGLKISTSISFPKTIASLFSFDFIPGPTCSHFLRVLVFFRITIC